jgi:hypothetical protein
LIYIVLPLLTELWGFVEEIVEAIDEHEELDRTHYRPADITDTVIAATLILNNQEFPLSPTTHQTEENDHEETHKHNGVASLHFHAPSFC